MAAVYIEVADDFSLPYDASLKSLRWSGEYDGRNGLERGFWVRVYAESNGVPGTLLRQEFRPGYACEQTFAPPGWYRYQMDLATPFSINAGQRYWISIQAELVTNTRVVPDADLPAGLGLERDDADWQRHAMGSRRLR